MKDSIRRIILIGLSISLVSACSSDKPDDKTSAANKMQTNGVEKKTPISHTLLNTQTTASDKQRFEQAFSSQCVARELKHSNNPDNDQPRLTKDCECIATFMMKDLTAIEAEKFLTEHQNSQSLTIKYENAAYHCLQQKASPPVTHLFSKS